MLKQFIRDPVILLKSFASVMYIIMGIFILALHFLDEFLLRNLENALGIILIVYGIFRVIRVYMEIKKKAETKQE